MCDGLSFYSGNLLLPSFNDKFCPTEFKPRFHFRSRARLVTKQHMSSRLYIGFLGAGKMATALAKGFVRAELVVPREIIASDPFDTARKHFAAEVGAKTSAANAEVAKFANVLILATKPDQVPAALAEISGTFTKNHLLISIAAGVTLAKLEAALPAGGRVIRVMPNTPALVGEALPPLRSEKMPASLTPNWQKNFCPPSASRFK